MGRAGAWPGVVSAWRGSVIGEHEATRRVEVEAARAPWPRRPARLGIAVLTSLIEQIVRGEIAVGSPLPTEPILCELFGVSRTVIRESLKLLEEKGLVRVKQGQGTTVVSSEQWNLLDPLVLEASIRNDETLKVLDDLVDVRVSLESQMARRAAERMTEAQRAELHAKLLDLESLLDRPQLYAVADSEYHDEISRISGNQLGRTIVRSVHPFADHDERYNNRDLIVPATFERSHRGHVLIYELLARGDAAAAAIAVSEHILGSWLAWREILTRRRGLS
jgi:DNA-binding FadR family transcriptional regulator